MAGSQGILRLRFDLQRNHDHYGRIMELVRPGGLVPDKSGGRKSSAVSNVSHGQLAEVASLQQA